MSNNVNATTLAGSHLRHVRSHAAFTVSMMQPLKFFSIAAITSCVVAQTCPGNEDIFPEGAVLAPGLCAQIYRPTADLVNELSRPRSLFVSPANEVFCLERAGYYEEWVNLTGYVVVYDDAGNDGTAEKATILASMTSLDHGLWVTDTHIYASNAKGVFRWPYTTGQRIASDPDSMEVVVRDIPAPLDQLHPTRTILIEDKILYLATGSEQNIDVDSSRANILRYNLTSLPDGGFDWTDGELVAYGVRNTVGMSMDKFGVLWGVDNGFDSAYRESLGGDINEDNPADELNRFPDLGNFYGYPYCFTEYILPDDIGLGKGTQWVLGNFTDVYTDEFCRSDNVTRPEVALQAHSAPLSIAFYEYKEVWPDDCPEGVAFPEEWDGDAFITYHGSYYRDEPIGAAVMRIPMTKDGQVDGGIDLEPQVVMEDADNGPEWLSGIRPVDVKFDVCGRLLVSSDGSYEDQDGRMIILIQAVPGSSPNPAPNSSDASSTRGATWFITLLVVCLASTRAFKTS